MTTDLDRGVPAHSRRRFLAPLPAAAFAVLLGLSCATPVQAAVTPDESPELSVAATSRGVLRPGAPLTATVTIQNTSDAALEGSPAVLEIGTEPLDDREDLRAWLAGSEDGIELDTIGAETADDVAAGQTGTVSITIPASQDRVAQLEPGVYPLRARYDGTTADSVVVVSDTTEPVGLVMPITAPTPDAGLLDADRLEELTGPDGALTAQLEAAGSETILAVDPAIPAAIRALGQGAPASAVEWLDRLMLLPNDRFALQFGDADVAAQLQAGLEAPLQPTSLEGLLAPAPAPAPSPTATPTATPTGSPASDSGSPDQDGTQDDQDDDQNQDDDQDIGELGLEDLLDIGEAQGSVYWPAPGDATAQVIDGLRAHDEQAVALTPSSATQEGADGSAVGARGVTSGGGAALVYDAAASLAVDAVARAEQQDARAAAAAAASAELWFAGRDAGDAPVLVALDRDLTAPPADPDAEATTPPATDLDAQLAAAIDVVTLSSAVEPQRLEDLLDARATPVTPADEASDEARVRFAAGLTEAERRVAETATVMERPEILTGIVRAEALQTLSVVWDGRDTQWRQVLDGFRERTRERARAVGIQDPTPVNLLTAGADLPVWVRNDLPYPISVTLLARPADPRLDVADATAVTVQPRSSSAVQVPVEARVGSGDVDIELTLVSPTGVVIGPRQTVEVTVRAEWERIGIVVLGVLVVGLIGTGIVRTVLRGRRRAAESAAAEQDDAPGTDTDAADTDTDAPDPSGEADPARSAEPSPSRKEPDA